MDPEPPTELEPPRLFERLLAALKGATRARCAFAHEIVRCGRRLLFAEVQAVGAADFCAVTAALEGASLVAYVSPRAAPDHEAWPGTLDPIGRFGLTDRDAARPLGAWPRLWHPGRVRSTIGMTVVHDGVLLGAVTCVRRLDEAPFGRPELEGARAIVADVQRGFVAAWRRRQRACRAAGSESFLVFDDGGEVISASRRGAPWLREPVVQRRVARIARRVATEGRAHVAFVRRARIRFEPLDGRGGRVLVIAAEPEHHRPGAREKLTRTQRRVADMAVVGATVREIAAGLDRSPETVRDHLRAIYARLGIGSRVELAQVLVAPPAA